MEEKVICTSQKLVNIANSIRSKLGITAKMTLDQMKAYVDQFIVPSGELEITSKGTYDVTQYASARATYENMESLIDRSVSGNVVSNVSTVGVYAFRECANLTGITLANATRIKFNAFQNCTDLINVNAPLCTYVEDTAFAGDSSLANLNLPSVETIEYNSFRGCTSLLDLTLPELLTITSGSAVTSIGAFQESGVRDVILPKVTSIGHKSFNKCNNLRKVILPSIQTFSQHASTNSYQNSIFYDDNTDTSASKVIFDLGENLTNIKSYVIHCNVKDIILRSPNMVTLQNEYVLDSTPVWCFGINGEGGNIYVPQSLISTYQADSIWNTIKSKNNYNQILPIEGSVYENSNWWKVSE